MEVFIKGQLFLRKKKTQGVVMAVVCAGAEMKEETQMIECF